MRVGVTLHGFFLLGRHVFEPARVGNPVNQKLPHRYDRPRHQNRGGLPSDLVWNRIADPQRWMIHVEVTDGVLPLQVRIKEKSVLQQGNVDVIEHGILDVDLFDFVFRS